MPPYPGAIQSDDNHRWKVPNGNPGPGKSIRTNGDDDGPILGTEYYTLVRTVAGSFYAQSPQVTGPDAFPLEDYRHVLISSVLARGVRVDSGSCTISILVNGSPVAGLTGISVTTTPADHAATGGATIPVGAATTLAVTAASNAVGLRFSLEGTAS